jgi:hypothetical protein
MNANEMAQVTAAVGGKPGTGKRRAGWLRRPARPALVAATAAAAVGLATLTAGAASASSIPNGPTVELNQYPMPTSPPAYQDGGQFLPVTPGAVGNPATIGVTGTNNNGFDSITVGSTYWGTQVTSSPFADPDAAPTQVWYFQRMGYVGVNTPATAGGPDMLAVPVYRIMNYNPEYGLWTCLQAGLGEDPAAGSIADSNDCDVNGTPQTNQLWVVGSPAESNDTINATTGVFDGGTSPQLYSDYLQAEPSYAPGLDDSVIENVAALADNGWNTSQAPVLSADASASGAESPISLQSQQEGTSVNSQNSTWFVMIGNGITPPPPVHCPTTNCGPQD